MEAEDIRPLLASDKSDLVAQRFNELLEVVQDQAERIERLETIAVRRTQKSAR